MAEVNPIIRLQRRIDALEAEKVQLRKQITELKSEVAEYERQLGEHGGVLDPALKWEMYNRIGMTGKELTIMFTLLGRPEGLTKGGLMAALYSHSYASGEVPEEKIIDVFICKLRKKLRERAGLEGVIDTVWGKGYRINLDRRDEVLDYFRIRRAVEAAQEDLTEDDD